MVLQRSKVESDEDEDCDYYDDENEDGSYMKVERKWNVSGMEVVVGNLLNER